MRLFRPLPCALLCLTLVVASCASSSPPPPQEQGANAPLEHSQAPIVRSPMPASAPVQPAPAKKPAPVARTLDNLTPSVKAAKPVNLTKAEKARLARAAKSSKTAPETKTAQPPKNLNLDKAKVSQNQHYKISYQSQPAQAQAKRPQEWKVKIVTKTGKPVTSAKVCIIGASQQGGKSAASAYLEAKNLGHGYYLAKELIFYQPGWWVVTVDVVNAGLKDRAQFNLLLK